jgi:hypothetical protein
VPCGTGGELRAFQKNDIRPASLGQTVKNGGADATSPDDNRARMSLHSKFPSDI